MTRLWTEATQLGERLGNETKPTATIDTAKQNLKLNRDSIKQGSKLGRQT